MNKKEINKYKKLIRSVQESENELIRVKDFFIVVDTCEYLLKAIETILKDKDKAKTK